MESLLDYLEGQAAMWKMRAQLDFDYGISQDISGTIERADQFTKWADLVRVMAPRPQSVEDGGEWCVCQYPFILPERQEVETCGVCGKPIAPPSRKERSVSGNETNPATGSE